MISKERTNVAEEPVNLNQVMDSLKKLDSRNRKLMQSMYILYVVFALFYTGLMILNPDPDLTLHQRFQGGMYVLIFGMCAVYFRYHFRKNKAVDYGAPVLEMLTAARNRHKLWGKGTVGFLIALVGLTDIVVTWALLDDKFLADYTLMVRILLVQAGYFLTMGISFVIGYLTWRRKSMPLVHNLSRIIDELQDEEIRDA